MAKKQEADDFTNRLEKDYAEAWVPKKAGDKIIGTVQAFDTGQSQYGTHPIVVIQDEDSGEERSVHVFHIALTSQLTSADPKVGDRVGIVYKGKRAPKGGGEEYHDYRVAVDMEAAEVTSFAALSRRNEAATDADEEAEDDLPF